MLLNIKTQTPQSETIVDTFKDETNLAVRVFLG